MTYTADETQEAIASPRVLYVVATNQHEADELADLIGHPRMDDAELHLIEVKGTPTDPYYAALYRIYRVIQRGPAEGKCS